MPPDTDDTTRIIVKLGDLLHAQRMTLTELAERVDITLANLIYSQDRQGQGHPFLHAGSDLP